MDAPKRGKRPFRARPLNEEGAFVASTNFPKREEKNLGKSVVVFFLEARGGKEVLLFLLLLLLPGKRKGSSGQLNGQVDGWTTRNKSEETKGAKKNVVGA